MTDKGRHGNAEVQPGDWFEVTFWAPGPKALNPYDWCFHGEHRDRASAEACADDYQRDGYRVHVAHKRPISD